MEKESVIAIMAAIIFTDVRIQKLTQRETIESLAKIAVSIYNKVYDNLHPYENKRVSKTDVR